MEEEAGLIGFGELYEKYAAGLSKILRYVPVLKMQ